MDTAKDLTSKIFRASSPIGKVAVGMPRDTFTRFFLSAVMSSIFLENRELQEAVCDHALANYDCILTECSRLLEYAIEDGCSDGETERSLWSPLLQRLKYDRPARQPYDIVVATYESEDDYSAFVTTALLADMLNLPFFNSSLLDGELPLLEHITDEEERIGHGVTAHEYIALMSSQDAFDFELCREMLEQADLLKPNEKWNEVLWLIGATVSPTEPRRYPESSTNNQVQENTWPAPSQNASNLLNSNPPDPEGPSETHKFMGAIPDPEVSAPAELLVAEVDTYDPLLLTFWPAGVDTHAVSELFEIVDGDTMVDKYLVSDTFRGTYYELYLALNRLAEHEGHAWRCRYRKFQKEDYFCLEFVNLADVQQARYCIVLYSLDRETIAEVYKHPAEAPGNAEREWAESIFQSVRDVLESGPFYAKQTMLANY